MTTTITRITLKSNGRPVPENVTVAATQLAIDTPHRLTLVGMLARPCVAEFVNALEHTHYPPETPANDSFWVWFIAWQDLAWIAVTVPSADQPHVDAIAAACGLRLSQTSPISVTASGAETFPLNGAHVRMLQNSPAWHALREELATKGEEITFARWRAWVEARSPFRFKMEGWA